MDQRLVVNEKATHRDSFVVRIWRQEGQSGWQGWVQHARTGEEACVHSLDELLSFIQRRAGLPSSPDRPTVHLK